MRRWPTDMPLALAVVASALLHAVAMLGPGWTLPHDEEHEPLQAVIVAPPAARPVPLPPEKRPPPRQATAPTPAPREAAPVVPVPLQPQPEAASASTANSVPPAIAPPPVAAAPVPPPAPPVPVIALPGRGQARYLVTRGEGGFVVGQSLHSWEHDGQRYSLQSVTETTGLIALFRSLRQSQSSRGEIVGDGLRPREYRTDNGSRSDSANFDWEGGKLSYGGREEPLPAGTQDLLSMIYQLALLAPESGSLVLPIVTGRKMERYTFTVLGTESLAQAGRERRAVHVRTLIGGDAIDVWLPAEARERRGLPLKIRISNRNGDIYDQTLDDPDLQK